MTDVAIDLALMPALPGGPQPGDYVPVVRPGLPPALGGATIPALMQGYASSAAVTTTVSAAVAGLAPVARTGAYADLVGAPGAYTLPTATTGTLGGVKQGAGVSIAGDGTLSAVGAVASFNGRVGAVVMSGADVQTALAYTPYSNSNPSGFQTAGQVTTAVSTAIAGLVNAAPGTLDTLGEIAAQLAADESAAAALTTAVGGKLARASNLADLGSPAAARTNLGLAPVAASGAYADLAGKPTIPGLATTGTPGTVKPDGITLTVAADGTLSVSGVAAAAYSGAIPAGAAALIVVAGVPYMATQAQMQTWSGAAPVTATAATIAGAPGTGTVGVAITGLTCTLTPSNATAYASLTVGGVEQTPRTAFTGTAVPGLTPASAGTATIGIYAAASGGSALATSGNVIVSAAPATSGTIGVPLGTPTVGQASTFAVAANAYPCWASITQGGVEQTPRTQVSAGGNVNMTPTAAGSSTASLYAAASGGTAIATTGSAFAVAAGATGLAALVPSGGTTLFALDASAPAGHLYTSNALSTQANAGDAVAGIKDKNGSSLNFTIPTGGQGGYLSTAGSLVASAQNGKSGLRIAGGSAFVESAASIRAAITAGQYVTIFSVFKFGSGGGPALWGSGNNAADETVNLVLINSSSIGRMSYARVGSTTSDTDFNVTNWNGNPGVIVQTIHASASGGTMTIDAKSNGNSRVTAYATIAAPTTTWYATILGASVRPGGGAALGMIGDIYCWAAFTSPAAPTTAERDAMHAYAVSAWGIT